MRNKEDPMELPEVKEALRLLEEDRNGTNQKPVEKKKAFGQAAKTRKREDERRKRLMIKRIFVASGNYDFLVKNREEEFTPFVKSGIVELLTEEQLEDVKAKKKSIAEKVTSLVAPLVPKKLMTAKLMCGTNALKEHPGFYWECADGTKHWVVPEIPVFTEQFREMGLIRKKYPDEVLARVDKLIESYRLSVKRLGRKESSIALRLTEVLTFDDMLFLSAEAFYHMLCKMLDNMPLEAEVMRESGKKEKAEEILRTAASLRAAKEEIDSQEIFRKV